MVLIVSVPDADKKEIKDWETLAANAGIKVIVTKYVVKEEFLRHEFAFLSIPGIESKEKERIEEILKKANVKTVIITDKACELLNI